MDRRDPMALSGSGTSYYTQRGMSGPPPPQQQQQPEGLHGSSAGIHALPSNPNVSFMAEPQMGQPEPAKRKRGRPRKYGPDGSVSLALSPSPVAAAGAGIGGSPTPKRSRGRPPGSGKKQQLASLGEWLSGSAGMGFTPHIITIAIGEDIATKIMSFSQQGPRAVCILSANGAVSTVTLRQPSTSGGTVTYEGRFEIICLSGSYLVTEASGSRNRSGGLSVSLASPDGRVIGGGVGGLLVAATPVQVIVGSFIWGSSKTKGNKRPEAMEAQTESIDNSPLVINNNNSNNMVPTQNLTPTASVGVWPSSRGLDMRNAHVDIDLMRG